MTVKDVVARLDDYLELHVVCCHSPDTGNTPEESRQKCIQKGKAAALDLALAAFDLGTQAARFYDTPAARARLAARLAPAEGRKEE